MAETLDFDLGDLGDFAADPVVAPAAPIAKAGVMAANIIW